MAESLLRGGIANLVGTYWPVRDDAAEKFAVAFYRRLLAGDALGLAMNAGRAAVKVDQAVAADRADYAFYGHPDFSLRR